MKNKVFNLICSHHVDTDISDGQFGLCCDHGSKRTVLLLSMLSLDDRWSVQRPMRKTTGWQIVNDLEGYMKGKAGK